MSDVVGGQHNCADRRGKGAPTPLPSNRGARLAFAFLFSALVACSESAPRNQGARPWASDDSWIDVEREASSGADVLLSVVLGLAFGHKHAVYVNDARQPGVLALDSLLRPRAIFGREGEGPGEFVVKANIQALPQDSLFVFDPAIKRATVFAGQRHDSSRATGIPAYVCRREVA